MKKSSLGRKSSIAPRKTSEFNDRNKSTNIPVFSRSKSSANLYGVSTSANSMGHKRDFSADRVSVYKSRDPSNDRMSEYLAFTPCGATERTPRPTTMSSGRASSMGGRKADDRPLADKEWQMCATQLISDVLNSDLFGSNILKNTKLKQKTMTLSLFVEICNYLLKKLDPSIEINKMNYITELQYRLKSQLQYRGKVDKTLLSTVNTMHNWPNVLGILHYLAEIVQASYAFESFGLDPLYPNNIGFDAGENDDPELNFRYVVPVLHEIWHQKSSQPDLTPQELLDINSHKFQEVITLSGYSDEVLQEEIKLVDQVTNLVCERDELEKHSQALEIEFGRLNERRNDVVTKQCASNDEIKELQAKLDEEIRLVTELDKDNALMEEELNSMNNILSQCNQGDEEVGEDDQELYQKKKKEIQENIRFENDNIYAIKEDIFEIEYAISEAKRQIEKKFRSYISSISKVLETDPSVKSAISYTRPKIGSTPYNDSTAALLNKTLETYEQKIKDIETKIVNSEENSDFKFNQNEQLKDKQSQLEILKKTHQMILENFDKKEDDLQGQLNAIDIKNKEIEDEIISYEEALKENKRQYELLEKEYDLKELKAIEFKENCKKKLLLFYQSIEVLDQKLSAMEDKERILCVELKNNVNKLLQSYRLSNEDKNIINQKVAQYNLLK